MASPNQQFYEITPDGREVQRQDSEEKKIPRLVWYIAGGIGGILIIILIIVLLINVLGSEKEVQEEANATLAQQFAECEGDDDVQACQEALRSELAREMGEIAVCEGLSEGEYANCIQLIAYDKMDESLCGVLTEIEKDDCRDLVYQTQAHEELSLKLCRKIVNETSSQACINSVTIKIIASGLCAEYDVDTALCDARRAMEDAATSGDAAACEALDEESAEICLDIIASVDEDGDGLYRQDEFENGTSDYLTDTDEDGLGDYYEVLRYFTDPTNVDTDGDGYSDGDEIAGGYDPLS